MRRRIVCSGRRIGSSDARLTRSALSDCAREGLFRRCTYVALAELLAEQDGRRKHTNLLESGTRTSADVALNALAVLYGKQNRFPEASATAVSEALQVNPDEPLSWLNLGVCLAGERR